MQPAPASQEDRREPAGEAEPAATPREQPGPIYPDSVHPDPLPPSNALPDDPAETVARALHDHPRTDARWLPPPED